MDIPRNTLPVRLEPRLVNAANLLVWRHFVRDLKLAGRSELTMQSYLEAAEQLEAFHGGALAFEEMTKSHVSDYLLEVLQEHSASTAANRFRSLRRIFNWMVREEFIVKSPMASISEPRGEDKAIAIPPVDDVRKLLATCRGKDHDSLRDEAIIRLFCEPGAPRVAEMAGILRDRVDFGLDVVLIIGKGNKWRSVPFGAKTGKAIMRYERARAKHPLHALPYLWLGARGKQLTKSGIYQMIERRCQVAGIAHIHPHALRHFAADAWFAAGGSEQDAMRLFGWTSLEMPRLYGRGNAEQRAIDAHRKMGLGDHL